MRIAVLVTGAPRTIITCAPSIKKLFHPKHQIDTFINIWGNDMSAEDKELVKSALNPVDFDFPMSLNWDAMREVMKPLDPNSFDIRTIFSKSWSNYKANMLRLRYEKMNNIRYDAVAFVRSDVMYGIEQFDPEPLLTDPKVVLQSIHHNFGLWSDQFIVCRDEAATHFASMVLWMIAEFPKSVHTNGMLEPNPPYTEWVHGMWFCGEINVKVWMERYGNYSRVTQDIPHRIVRGPDAGKPFHQIVDNNSARDPDGVYSTALKL